MGLYPLTSPKSKEKKCKKSNKSEGVLQGQTEITCGHSYGHSLCLCFCVLDVFSGRPCGTSLHCMFILPSMFD